LVLEGISASPTAAHSNNSLAKAIGSLTKSLELPQNRILAPLTGGPRSQSRGGGSDPASPDLSASWSKKHLAAGNKGSPSKRQLAKKYDEEQRNRRRNGWSERAERREARLQRRAEVYALNALLRQWNHLQFMKFARNRNSVVEAMWTCSRCMNGNDESEVVCGVCRRSKISLEELDSGNSETPAIQSLQTHEDTVSGPGNGADDAIDAKEEKNGAEAEVSMDPSPVTERKSNPCKVEEVEKGTVAEEGSFNSIVAALSRAAPS
jgi:hypothetical protein